jgi:SAM-dependent methyltransferase
MSEHYRRGEGLEAILAKIDALSGDLSPDSLAPLDQFHGGGLAATRELARMAAIKPGEQILDAGCGIGGPARLLAAEHGARVRGIDLSGDFIAIARALSKKSGIAVEFEQADALKLPFGDGTFDLVWTQHASMNIADKTGLYRELRRVLRPGGRLAFHDLLAGDKAGALQFPLLWADGPEESFLIAGKDLRQLLPRCGFREIQWQDRTAATLAFFDKRAASPTAPSPLGIHLLLGPDFPKMAANLRENLREGRVGAAMAVYAAAPMQG